MKRREPLYCSGSRLFTGYTESCAEWWFGRRCCGRRGWCRPESGRFARLNDNGLLISRDFDCTGEKGDKLGGTPQMRLRLPMVAGSQLHIVDGELPVFIVRKKAVRRYIENYQKPDFDLAIQGTLRYTDTC